MPRLRDPGEDGAVAVLVAILLGSGVLLGIGALVIDVGLIGVERTQLQSGADTGAWAVAEACALQAPACANPSITAAKYATANVKDGSAGVTTAVCQANCGGTSTLSPCPPVPAALNGGLAQVRTSTRNDDGSTLLPPTLAQAMGYPGTTVVTCAQVSWGVPDHGVSTGIAIGDCEWKQLAGAPDGQPDETEIQLSQNTPCGTSTAPEFGFAGDPDCSADVSVGAVVAGSDGSACGQVLSVARDAGTPIVVPIVDSTTTGGYQVAGLAGFVVTNYILVDPGDIGGLPPPGCAPDVTCITGHFTGIVIPAHNTLPGTTKDYGAAVVSRIG